MTKTVNSSSPGHRLINEVLAGVRIIKLYAWEKAFAAKIATARDEEIAVFRSVAFQGAARDDDRYGSSSS